MSPIVVGLALLLVYSGRTGWLGQSLESAGFQIIYAPPGMILATAFVSLPLVIRELVPVLTEIGTDAGAGGPQPRRLTAAVVPADHPAGDQVGAAVRRGAQPRPLAR